MRERKKHKGKIIEKEVQIKWPANFNLKTPKQKWFPCTRIIFSGEMGVNANKLPLPTTRNSRSRNQIAVALSYRIEFWLFVCIVTVMAIGLWITVLITNEYTGIRLKEAID